MEPSLQPSFTFPSRHDKANLATGLKAQLNMDYVTSVPARATDINIETDLYRADVIVPMGQKETLDPKGVLPMPQNIYVQPGIAEGLTNVSQRDNAELTIMKTMSANNALKRGNYQAAEHVMGRGTTVEEIQNQTTTPSKRSSQMGGPDIHVGRRSQHIGVPVRNGPNYQSMAHIASELGSHIDDLAKQYNIPEDQVVRLKIRYNLFTPASARGRPNVPVGWQSIWELVRRDLEGLRTGTSDIISNAPGTSNALHQAGGTVPPPAGLKTPSMVAPPFTVSANPPGSQQTTPVQVRYSMADRIRDVLSSIPSLTGGKIKSGKRVEGKMKGGVVIEEEKDPDGDENKLFSEKLDALQKGLDEDLERGINWNHDNYHQLANIINEFIEYRDAHQRKISAENHVKLDRIIKQGVGLLKQHREFAGPVKSAYPTISPESVKTEPPSSVDVKPTSSSAYPHVVKDNELSGKHEGLPTISWPRLDQTLSKSEVVNWIPHVLGDLSKTVEGVKKNRAEWDYDILQWLKVHRDELSLQFKTNKGKGSNWPSAILNKAVRTLREMNKLITSIEKSPELSGYQEPPVKMSDVEVEDEKYTAMDVDQDLAFARAPGNTTSDFSGNNQVIAKEEAAGEEQPSIELQGLPVPSSQEVPPADNPIIQEYVVDAVPLTHRSDDNRTEQATIYRPYDQELHQVRREPHFASSGAGLNRSYIPQDNEYNLSRPATWSINTQIQNPASYTQRQVSNAKKAEYIFHRPVDQPYKPQNNTLDTYTTKRYIAAPLTEQLMTRTGRNAVPISAQVQSGSSNNHALWETNVRRLAKEPSSAGEQLRNEFLPQPPPQEMYAENIGSKAPRYRTYDNTIPLGTGGQHRAFGKHFIHIDKLFTQGIISLTQANGKKVSRVKNESIARGGALHSALCRVVEGKRPTKKMTVDEKLHFDHLCRRSGVTSHFKAGAVNVNPLAELHIAMGEINAGNNSPALKAQIRRLLEELAQTKKLSGDQISSIRTHYLA